MPSPFEVILLCLACWRLTHLVQYERGPLALLARIRALASVQHDGDGEPIAWPDTEVGRLLRCHWCGSVWVALGLVGLYLAAPNVAVLLSLPLAISAVAIAVQEVCDGKG